MLWHAFCHVINKRIWWWWWWWFTLEPLQGLQNAAVRLVFGLGWFDHVTPSLIKLHWLPVIYRVKFKLCCIIHAIYHGRSPTYLSEVAQSVSASRWRFGLRSSSTSLMDYALPRLRKKFGERAFSHAGPATWNALLDYICTVADPVKFWRLLKSYYFRIAFSVCWTVWTVLFFVSVLACVYIVGLLYCTYVLLCNSRTIIAVIIWYDWANEEI